MTNNQEYRIRLENGAKVKELVLTYAEEGEGSRDIKGRAEDCLHSFVAHTQPEWSIVSISRR
jgi:hypothetical protein